MDGKYLASNIGPLKTIGDGKVFIAINDLINARNDHRYISGKGELVAYEIRDSGFPVTHISCLINTQYGLHYRYFTLYNSTGTIDDGIKKTASYGFGFHDVNMDYFIELREFYFQNKEVPAEV